MPGSPIQKLEIRLASAEKEDSEDKPLEDAEITFYRTVLQKMRTKHINAARLNHETNARRIYKNYLKLNKMKGLFSDISPGIDKATMQVGEVTDTDPFLKE